MAKLAEAALVIGYVKNEEMRRDLAQSFRSAQRAADAGIALVVSDLGRLRSRRRHRRAIPSPCRNRAIWRST